VFVVGFVGSAHAQILTGFSDEIAPEPAYETEYVPEPYVTPEVAAVDVLPQSSSYNDSARLTGFSEERSSAPNVPAAENATSNKESAPVDLQADNLSHDEQSQIITASGNVMLVQSGRILRADEIKYNLANDQAFASGHVVLNEENGDIHYADQVELEDNLKNGFVKGLKTYLADGSRFEAKDGQRTNGSRTTMHTALFTPCEPCKTNPDKAPVWQIKASEVTHDTEAQRISYENARFEVLGVPIAYTPYFSHADGSVERKSGFLSPTFGYKSKLGAFAGTSYYWAAAPDKDATLGVTAFTDVAPLAELEYRQRWNNAQIDFNGGLTYSERQDDENGVEVTQDDEVRGHILADALWDMNEKWRSGLDVEWASDDQYMRQYDIYSEDVLESRVYAERFSGRNYAIGEFVAFQDLRVDEDINTDQPEILPEIQTSFLGEPGSVPVLGGRWSADAGMLSLMRDGSEQDVMRLNFDAGWYRRFVSDYGLLLTADAKARTDVFHVSDRTIASTSPGRSSDSSVARFFPQLHLTGSYPLTRDFEGGYQAVIEPTVALTAAPNIEDQDDDIPNEDSQDVQLDTSNLFEPDRFTGRDLVEDRSRVTYGVRTGLYDYDGSQAEVFVGQSKRFKSDDNPFPAGSGLNQQESDYVGEISARYQNAYNLNYRFQLDSESLSSQRHEVDTALTLDRFSLGSRYLFATSLEGTDIFESREQIQANAGYYLTPNWRVQTGAVQDLGLDPGLRRAQLGLDYFGQCLSWSVTGVRNLTRDISGESSTAVLFRIGLKNLGDFETSTYNPVGEE
jgi:LPS-assembly protein